MAVVGVVRDIIARGGEFFNVHKFTIPDEDPAARLLFPNIPKGQSPKSSVSYVSTGKDKFLESKLRISPSLPLTTN